jgi:large subunit ribosomal protein L15
MKLNEIRRPDGNKRPMVRKGRGSGTGKGKTSGRGEKGQGARSGAKNRAWFEGGQMPLNRRLPKRGFTNIFTKRFQVVNLRDLDRVGDASPVNAEVMWEKGLIRDLKKPVKLLGDGQVAIAYQIEVQKASKSAVAAIEAAGGTVTLASKKV